MLPYGSAWQPGAEPQYIVYARADGRGLRGRVLVQTLTFSPRFIPISGATFFSTKWYLLSRTVTLNDQYSGVIFWPIFT